MTFDPAAPIPVRVVDEDEEGLVYRREMTVEEITERVDLNVANTAARLHAEAVRLTEEGT